MSLETREARRGKLLARLPGVIALALAAVLVAYGHDLAAPFAYEPIGPRAFPLLLAALLAVNGLWLLFAPARPSAPASGVQATLAAAEGEGTPEAPFFGRGVVLVLAAVFGYALLFETAGFPIATALMTIAIGRVFGGGWLHCIVVGVAMGLGLHLFFDRLLDVTLPAGWLAGVI